jgi:ribosomal protein S18 acetylase RimI-like enzyme
VTDKPPDVRFRPLGRGDGDALVTATLENMNWCGDRFTREQVLASPDLRRYTEIDSARGDLGVVAVDGDRVVAVAWAQFLLAPGGYGFVDDETPECSVWVAAGSRGRGLGRAVTRQLLDDLRERGVGRVSLSVEAGNTTAVGVYRSLGFASVAGREADGVMVRDLAR